MNKERVTIQFTSLTRLWEFRLAVNARVFEMNLTRLILITDCTPEQVELAVTAFKGKKLEQQEKDIAHSNGDRQTIGSNRDNTSR